MNDDKEFIPIRRRWFVQRNDYGRSWWIQPVEEDGRGFLRVCEIIPGRNWRSEQVEMTRSPMHPRNILTGNEDVSAYCTPEEAQGLMDALWEAGMRPRRA